MAVLLLDDEFRVADLNTAFELGLDFTRDEIVGRTLASITDGENAAHMDTTCAQMARGNLTHSILNCRVTSRNGRQFDSVVHLSVLSVDDDRRYLAMFQSLDEISERERLLLSQSEMFRVTIEQSPLPMSIQDHRYRFVMVNRAYCEFTGYSQAELIGRDAVDFLHPRDDLGPLHEQRKLVSAHGLQQLSRFSLRRELIHRNGRRLPYRIEVGRSRGLDGQPLWVAVLIDLTKQERAEAGQAALLQCVSAGLAHVIDGRMTLINPALSLMLGMPENKLLNRSVAELFDAPDTWNDIARSMAEPHAGAEPMQRHEVVLRVRPGDPRRRCNLIVRHVDPQRPDLGLLLTLNDVSALLEQSDQLRRSIDELEDIIDTEPVGIAQLQFGRIIRVNRAMRRLLGRDDDELQGRELLEYFEAGQADKRQFFSQLQLKGPDGPRRDLALRARAKLPAGLGASCLLHLSPPEAGSGYWVVIALDLSQHNAAISLATRMQMRFDTFAAIVDDGIAIVDLADDRLCQANEATGQVLGLDRPPEAGEPSAQLWQSLVPADRARAQAALQQAAGQRSQELVVRRQDSSEMRSVKLRFFAAQGLSEVFIQAEDITEILMLEQRRLDDAFAQRETLVREVHHRIKNNLQGIAGLLEQTALDQPELLRPVRILASRIQTIAQVHGLQIHPGRAIPLGELVEAITLSIEQALGRPMRVELRDRPTGLSARGLPEREVVPMALIINELATNAFKHGTEDPQVSIVVHESPTTVKIDIRNRGQLPPGIDPLHNPGASRGLGLVLSLLPKKTTSLVIRNADQATVIAELSIDRETLAIVESDAIDS